MSVASKVIKKNDIKSGYVVRLRNGDHGMVIRAGAFSKIVISKDGVWNYLSEYNDDLKLAVRYGVPHACSPTDGDRARDIMEVYGLIRGTANYPDALKLATSDRELLWKRPDVVKMTVKEISEKLGFDVQIVAEK